MHGKKARRLAYYALQTEEERYATIAPNTGAIESTCVACVFLGAGTQTLTKQVSPVGTIATAIVERIPETSGIISALCRPSASETVPTRPTVRRLAVLTRNLSRIVSRYDKRRWIACELTDLLAEGVVCEAACSLGLIGFPLHFLVKCTKKGQFLHFPIENRRKRGENPTCAAVSSSHSLDGNVSPVFSHARCSSSSANGAIMHDCP